MNSNVLANKQSLSRQTTFKGEVEYTKINYNIDYFKQLCDITNDKISKLQMTIESSKRKKMYRLRYVFFLLDYLLKNYSIYRPA